MAIHYSLRSVLILNAPQLDLFQKLLPSLQSAWLPGGLESLGQVDAALKAIWFGFVTISLVIFFCIGSKVQVGRFIALCLIGVILWTPALGIPRAFGIAMPSFAFFSAISVAVIEVWQRTFDQRFRHRFWKPVILSFLLLGMGVGAGAGIRRSLYVAEALHENSYERAIRDGQFVFGLYGPATIPADRREAELLNLSRLGILSRDDLSELDKDPQTFIANRKTPLFLQRYGYLRF